MSGSNNDPFGFQGDPNAPSALGQTVGFWQDVARYGGNVAAQASARTASGHLVNGTGALGAIGAAINPTLDAARQNAVTRSNLGVQQQQARHLGMENELLSYQMPVARQSAALTQQFMADPAAAQRYMSGFYPSAASTDGSTAGPPGLIGSESGGNPGAVSKATGASGLAQFTPGRLADLGMYQPGQSGQGGQWGGTFNIPGFPGVKSYQDFLANPQAQQAAYGIHMADVQKNITQTPGAAQFDPNGLAAVAHLGGIQGMRRFVATNGQYNPADANGTSLMDYYQKFSGHGAASPASGPRVAATAPPDAGASAGLPPPVQVAGPGAPTGSLPVPPVPPPGGDPSAPPALAADPNAPTAAPSGAPAAPPQQLTQAQPQPGPGPMVPGGRQRPAPQVDQGMLNQALGYERQAAILEQQQSIAKMMQARGVPVPMPPGDPAMLRTAGSQYRAAAIAPFTEAAKGAAAAPFKMESVRPGSILYDGNGNVIGSAPHESLETVPDGPNAGRQFTVMRSPVDNSLVGAGTSSGGAAGEGAPAGSLLKSLSPAELETQKNQANVQVGDIDHDRKIMESDLSHVIDSGMQNKANLLHLRDLIPQSSTGFAGETRAGIQNFLQTVLPASVAGQFNVNASPAQELMKITTMGAGKADQEDHGAAKALGLMQLYMKAYPNMENQPDANQHMTNLLLVAQQAHMDYTLGANDHYMQSRDAYATTGKYTPLNRYDAAYTNKMPAETYFAAADALNGQPYEKWSKGLTGPQLQVVGGILQRADPNAQVSVGGKMVSVSAFTKTIGPTQLVSPNGR